MNERGEGMDDEKIIKLYWDRNEEAITESERKYGTYCAAIAKNILGSNHDAEECVNDTWLKAWQSMPPHRPNLLSVFLGKITRNLSLSRWRYASAEKRGSGQRELVLEELEQVISGKDSVEQEIDRKELLGAINAFLTALPEKKRSIFLCRYWYMDSVGEIALRFGMTENAVSVTLNRLRKKLKEYLLEGGFEL